MTWTQDVPLVPRYALLGAVGLGVTGAVAGLVLGLAAHPATAWFAVLEVGVPAAHLGLLAGLGAGAVRVRAGRIARRIAGPTT
ncbi:hypothetical protein [Nocardioides lianchengensis]|uniref:Uncharacterized protein n=1 Tax=Nocardioides lianchengensis TaxID=1045774 RepID=A0A1G6W195_9ACTN|nr:hypothetical protein [Nocardioides lianchengensis]NYG09477.1 hypothetical protein [Nocardioides lianchengensis]SDD59611.1 hypothetical protein SAMN05421872_109131 [Nocardioides lianchengensis]